MRKLLLFSLVVLASCTGNEPTERDVSRAIIEHFRGTGIQQEFNLKVQQLDCEAIADDVFLCDAIIVSKRYGPIRDRFTMRRQDRGWVTEIHSANR